MPREYFSSSIGLCFFGMFSGADEEEKYCSICLETGGDRAWALCHGTKRHPTHADCAEHMWRVMRRDTCPLCNAKLLDKRPPALWRLLVHCEHAAIGLVLWLVGKLFALFVPAAHKPPAASSHSASSHSGDPAASSHSASSHSGDPAASSHSGDPAASSNTGDPAASSNTGDPAASNDDGPEDFMGAQGFEDIVDEAAAMLMSYYQEDAPDVANDDDDDVGFLRRVANVFFLRYRQANLLNSDTTLLRLRWDNVYLKQARLRSARLRSHQLDELLFLRLFAVSYASSMALVAIYFCLAFLLCRTVLEDALVALGFCSYQIVRGVSRSFDQFLGHLLEMLQFVPLTLLRHMFAFTLRMLELALLAAELMFVFAEQMFVFVAVHVYPSVLAPLSPLVEHLLPDDCVYCCGLFEQ